ncbi:MAG: hypothetical protein MZV70_72355 [Desulfobacterales bacterium]|nr:hypothetical protein [Desulfobacterales bacterium]
MYIGGGFPETQAGTAGRKRILPLVPCEEAAEAGLPIYAECGGFIYLGESLTIGDKHYPMAGALPVTFGMEKRPQGHGYTVLDVDRENPFFPVGTDDQRPRVSLLPDSFSQRMKKRTPPFTFCREPAWTVKETDCAGKIFWPASRIFTPWEHRMG